MNRKLAWISNSTFIRNFLLYLGGGVFAKLIGLANFLIIGKLLIPEKYAILVLFLFAADFLSVFVRFGLSSSIIRLARENHIAILNNALAVIFCFWMIISATILVAGDVATHLLKPEYKVLLSLKFPLVLRMLSISIIELLGAYYIILEIPKKFVIVNIATSGINTLFLIGILLFGVGGRRYIVNAVIWINAFAGIGGLAIAIFISKRFLNPFLVKIPTLFDVIHDSTVYFAKNLIGILQTYASQIVLSVISSSYLLGVYSFYQMFFTQSAWIFGIFNQTFLPKVRNLIVSKEYSARLHGRLLITKSFKTYLLFSSGSLVFCLLILFILKSREHYFTLFLRLEYLKNANLFYAMLIAFFLGNLRSFYEIWQYMVGFSVGIHLLISNILALAFIYFGNIYFYGVLGIYGIVLNQVLLYIIHFTYTIICYKHFVLNRENENGSNQVRL